MYEFCSRMFMELPTGYRNGAIMMILLITGTNDLCTIRIQYFISKIITLGIEYLLLVLVLHKNLGELSGYTSTNGVISNNSIFKIKNE